VTELSASNVSFPASLKEGDVVAGRYRLERVIGKGGMGVVVLAHHLELEERVAVKFLTADALSEPEAVARFDREIRAAARLKNEHVARVYDAGKLPDGGRFMVLEYLDGEDLAARVRRLGPLNPVLAVRYVLQACAAVLEAHGLGIVHRDLKPGNLFVVPRTDGAEVVKVLDFGVMKRLLGSKIGAEPQQTEPGTIVGTPYYTSPEQLRGSTSVDIRSDIWSLGATLFELLCGVPPFSGTTYPQVIANVLESEPPALEPLCPTLPPGLGDVVVRCLKKDPAERFENVAELAVALSETVEFDSEQRGLLERIVRQRLVSSPIASPPALLTPRGTSSHDHVGALLNGGSRHRTKREMRYRVLIIAASAAATAAGVFGLGWSLLPHPAIPVPRTLAPRHALTRSPNPSDARNSVLSPPSEVTPGPVPSIVSVSAAAPAVKPAAVRVPRHLPTKAATATATAIVTEQDSAPLAAAPSVAKKNPLLVQPK